MDSASDSEAVVVSIPAPEAEMPSIPASTSSCPQQEASVCRDATFYHDDGDCVFMVGTTLFMVHKFLFRRDGSTFGDLFGLPQGERKEGTCDESPIVLEGDTIGEFRALCWALYLPLLEARLQDTKQVNMPRLLDLAFITNKYKFATTERWTTDLLLHHCNTGAGRVDFAKTCTPEQLESLIDISLRTQRPDLRTVVEQKWLVRLKAKEVPAAFTLDVGERFQLRSFLGRAYHTHLIALHGPKSPKPVIGSAVRFDTGELDHIHVQRLRTGFISLCLTWNAITNMPGSDINGREWETLFKDYHSTPPDILSALKDIRETTKINNDADSSATPSRTTGSKGPFGNGAFGNSAFGNNAFGISAFGSTTSAPSTPFTAPVDFLKNLDELTKKIETGLSDHFDVSYSHL